MTSPSFSTTTRSHSSTTARITCSTNTTATPRSRIPRRSQVALLQLAHPVGRCTVDGYGHLGRTEVVGLHEQMGAGKEVVLRGELDRVAVPGGLHRDPLRIQSQRKSEQAAERVSVRSDVTNDADRRSVLDRLHGLRQARFDIGGEHRKMEPGVRGLDLVDVIEDRVDAATLDRRVIDVELKIGKRLQTNAASGLCAQEGCGTLESGLSCGTLLLVAENRVVDVRARESGVTLTAVIVTKPMRGSFTERCIRSPSTSRMFSPTRWVLLVLTSVLPGTDVVERVQDLDAVVVRDKPFDLSKHLLCVKGRLGYA